MKYERLAKLYYRDRNAYETELESRRTSLAASVLDFTIHGNQAFYLAVPELMRLHNSIFLAYGQFLAIYNKLPPIAQDCYCRKCLIDEIILTNDLEGVHSTRRDVLNVLQADKRQERSARFSGLIRKYLLLTEPTDERIVPLSSLADVRAIYDDIVLDEIKEDDRPDGEFFRTGPVSVLSATDRVKHQGVSGESAVNQCMAQALAILKDEDHTLLTRIAIFHYLFGYIHPFYDGNGRLSRFISSSLLAKDFHPIVAYRLSYTIKECKKDYYDAFDFINDRHSGGDLTPFILIFSELVYKSILSLKEKVEEASQRLSYYWKLLRNVQNEDYKSLIFTFVQNALFSPDPFTIKELTEVMGKSALTVRKNVKHLIDSGIPIKVNTFNRAYEYDIDLDELPQALENCNL